VMRRSWYDAVRVRLSGLGFKILADLMASGSRPPRTAEISAALRARSGGQSKLDSRVIADLAALLIEKRTGGLIPARFTLFACVGATGLAVHLAIFESLRLVTGGPFLIVQAMAILGAMTWNFFLNNALTFRDLRLTGPKLLRGLLAFYASCAGGALLSEAIGAATTRVGAPWVLASAAGAVSAALWNYWSTAGAVWKPRAAAGTAGSQAFDASSLAPAIATPIAEERSRRVA